MVKRNSRIALVGASSSIAEHCARLWAISSPEELILVGRSEEKLAAIARDLNVRSPNTKIRIIELNFLDKQAIDNLANDICSVRSLDVVLIAHGTLPDQKQCQQDLRVNEDSLLVNGVSPVLIAEAFAARMERHNSGTIAVIGSVAGDRGRKSNYVYGSAKGLVTRYVQGMQHRFAGSGIKVVLIKPGPTDTPMTEGFKQKGAKLASVEDVAKTIVDGISAGKETIYAPGKWAIIMMIIRHLPKFIFNKMDI